MTISQEEQQLVEQFRRLVAADLQELMVLNDREPTEEILIGLRQVAFPDSLGLKLRSEQGQQSCDLMRRGLVELPESVDQKTLDKLASDFAAIYLNHTYRAFPAESTWMDEEGLTRQEPMFQVRMFYDKYGLKASEWNSRTEDHLVLEIQFLIHLLELDQERATLVEITKFLDEHLLRWIGRFAQQVTTYCETSFYAGVVSLTAVYLDELRDMLAEILSEPRPSPEEIEQRMKPKHIPITEVPLQYVPGVAESW
jgi:TorA maturation chaperone TorD